MFRCSPGRKATAHSASLSRSGQTVLDYIATQAAHHEKWSYEQEFVTLVKKSGVEHDPKYLFG